MISSLFHEGLKKSEVPKCIKEISKIVSSVNSMSIEKQKEEAQLAQIEEKKKNRMIIFNQNVGQFVDLFGNTAGPFASGELANLENEVAEILVSGGKAAFVDENN